MWLALTAPSLGFAQAHGNMDSTIGNIKDTVGGAIGNNEMQAKGKAQHASGAPSVPQCPCSKSAFQLPVPAGF